VATTARGVRLFVGNGRVVASVLRCVGGAPGTPSTQPGWRPALGANWPHNSSVPAITPGRGEALSGLWPGSMVLTPAALLPPHHRSMVGASDRAPGIAHRPRDQLTEQPGPDCDPEAGERTPPRSHCCFQATRAWYAVRFGRWTLSVLSSATSRLAIGRGPGSLPTSRSSLRPRSTPDRGRSALRPGPLTWGREPRGFQPHPLHAMQFRAAQVVQVRRVQATQPPSRSDRD
jgi:hypothetical protein